MRFYIVGSLNLIAGSFWLWLAIVVEGALTSGLAVGMAVIAFGATYWCIKERQKVKQN